MASACFVSFAPQRLCASFSSSKAATKLIATLFAVEVSLLYACGAHAQQQPVFTTPPSSGALLYFDVEANDKSGLPVSGLQAGDFTVLDNHSPSAVQSFNSHQSAHAQADSVTIIIDDVNVNFSAPGSERAQIEAFLRNGGKDLPVPVSVYVLGQLEMKRILGPSNDGNELAEQFAKWSGHLAEIPWSADWGAIESWQTSLEALDKIVSAIGPNPGRKLLIWISPGWPVFSSGEMSTTDKQLHWIMNTIVHFSTKLLEDDITLDVVDPLGSGSIEGLTSSSWQSQLKPAKKWQQAAPGKLALQVLAVQSGGLVLYRANDIAGALSRCMQDGSTWYTLGVAPQHASGVDVWHNLEIKVNKPGVLVRTRNGYYAEP